MDQQTRCRAMIAMCRQHARMAGENKGFWMSEAERWQFLLDNLETNNVVDIQQYKERNRQRKATQ
jgi:hypothetical protein